MLFDHSPDRALACAADDQGGVFSDRQAQAAGFTRRQVSERVRRGEWVVVLPRVYRLAGAAHDDLGRTWAASLWAGAGAVVSHRSAARALGLDVARHDRAEITVPRGRNPRTPLVEVRRTSTLVDADVWFHRGLRLTSPVRTIIDLATLLDDEDVEVALESARRAGFVTCDAVLQRLAQFPRWHRPGWYALAALSAITVRRAPAASRAEVVVGRRLRTSGLPEPLRRYEIRVPGGWIEPAFAWPRRRVALEIGDVTPIARGALAAAGWDLLSVGPDDLGGDPRHLVGRIAAALHRAA